MSRHFRELLEAQWADKKMLCIGLDPDFNRIPEHLKALGVREGLRAFCMAIIDATHDIAGSYKPNSAFFEAYGADGWAVLGDVIRYIHERAPQAPVIADCKRGDIGTTNAGYVAAIFDDLRADAITVQPYLGSEALAPFLEREEKGVIVLCRTSNPGAGEFQDLTVHGVPLYQVVAKTVSTHWNTRGNCGLVVGATYPDELRAVRECAPELPLLIPGIGAQGGDIQAAVQAGVDARGAGMIISASRAILYADSTELFASAARTCAQMMHGAMREAAVR